MTQIQELANDAQLLMESIMLFTYNTGSIDSRLALGLSRLTRTMQELLDSIQELVMEEESFRLPDIE